MVPVVAGQETALTLARAVQEIHEALPELHIATVQVAVEGMLREKAIADAVKAAIEQGARILGPKLDAVALGALEGSFHLGGAIERGATPIVGERSREWVMPITRREPDRP